MGIDAWSTTAASNNASPPDGAPEGQAAGTVNNTMRQMMASVRAWFEDAQWINLGLTPTRVDADTFTLSGDVTTTFHVGRRLKVTGSATGYATISASTYSAPNTTVDVTMDSGSLPVTLTSVYVSILTYTNTAIPAAGAPAWTGAASGGSLTLTTPLAVTSGGTGTTTVAGIRSAIGVSATGSDTTYSFRANNLSDLTSALSARANLGLATIASSGSATDLTSGQIPDARYQSSFPAINAANLTNLNASALAIGTVANARLPNVGLMPGVTISADPGGTPSGAPGAVFCYY
jgi:hypothetical protein